MSEIQAKKTIDCFTPYCYVVKQNNKFYMVIANPHDDDDSWNEITAELFEALVHFNMNYPDGMNND